MLPAVLLNRAGSTRPATGSDTPPGHRTQRRGLGGHHGDCAFRETDSTRQVRGARRDPPDQRGRDHTATARQPKVQQTCAFSGSTRAFPHRATKASTWRSSGNDAAASSRSGTRISRPISSPGSPTPDSPTAWDTPWNPGKPFRRPLVKYTPGMAEATHPPRSRHAIWSPR